MSFRIDQLAVLNLATVGNSITAGSFVKSGGTSSQFLKADGSVDSSTYITGITSGMITTALGYTPVPNTRTLTINGTSYDLSADRSWTISAGVSSVSGSGAGISVSPTTGAVVISNTGVTSNVAGTGISVSGATGAVTITNTGVTSIVAGTGISISGATGAVTVTNSGVTSVNGSTGAITGIITTSNYNSYSPTLTGTGASGTWGISITGSAANSTTVGGLTPIQFFNNMGNNHGTYTNFNSIPDFGFRFVQGTTNGPGTGSTQFYGVTLGLGNEYPYSSYALQLAIPRDITSDRYLTFRTREATTWGSWYKISAGYADSAGNADTVDGYHATNAASGLAYYASNGYLYVPSWINIGTAGIFSGTNNAHIRPNQSTSYGAWEMIGSRSGWSGIWFNDSGNHLMMNNNESGHYMNGYGWQFRWYQGTMYINRSTYGGTGTEYTMWDSGNLTNLNQLSNGPGYITGNQTITLSGDVSGSGATSISVTVNQIDGWTFVNTGSNSPTAADSINSNGISYVATNISLFGQTDGGLFSQAYNSSWQHQIYGDYRTGQIAIRGKQNGTWQAWRVVLDSSNYSSYIGGVYLPYGNWVGTTGMNDYKLYLRTNGDNNHYLWNAGDDWEELNAYEGTGFRITSVGGSVGVLYVYGSSNGGYTYSPYSFRAPIFYDSDDTNYYADFHSTSNSGIRLRGGMLIGPNTTWGAYLQVGGNGHVSSSYANVVTTDGNLHLDSASSKAMYLNYYVNGTIYLNGTTYYINSNGSYYNGRAENVTVNYNNDSNSTYQLLWGSGNSVYGTSDVWVNPSSDIINARGGFISNGNPWGTSNSAYFPNGITTAGGTNWVYGSTYIGNAPGNGSGSEVSSVGSFYFRNANTSGSWGYAGLFVDRNNAANNYVPYSFEAEYGNHSWGIVARFHIQTAGQDKPAIQFTSAGSNERWSIGYCTASDFNFRITQNQGYRTDNSASDGWGTERFRIDTSGTVSVINAFNAYSIQGNSNVAGTGNASYHPSGIYSTSTNWLYGTMYLNNNTIFDAGNIYNSGWYRNYGQTGLYSQTYDNHFASYDTTYWRLASGSGLEVWSKGFGAVRGYLYTDGSSFGLLNSSGQWAVRAYGGSETQIMWNGSWRGIAQSNGFRVNGNLYTDVDYGYGLVGVYTSTRYQGVFAMGDAYKLPSDGTSTGNLYGLTWSHPNAGGVAGNLNTHGLLVLENGTFLAAVSGSIRARDDMRAPIFYDSVNTSYYLDPDSNSYLSKVRVEGISDTSYTRIVNPDGGRYVTTTSTVTGAIRIKLPTQGSAMMMTCTVKVYEYTTNKSFNITFGGHRDGANWYNEFCFLDGGDARGELTVRFGVDGGKDCVYIGETNTSWSYPQVFVTDVQLGYTGYNVNWLTGWEVGFVTAFATVNRTQTAYRKLTPANYNSYAPTLTGGGASGTWSINITGSAGTASTVTHFASRTDATFYNIVWASGNPSHMYSCDAVQIRSSDGAIRANIYLDNQDTSYYCDPNSLSRLNTIVAGYNTTSAPGVMRVSAGHGDTSIRLTAQGLGSGNSPTMQWWVSEPGITWDEGGFGYNVTNDGGSPNGFSRPNTSWGQAYMRFTTSGSLIFYNTNTSGTRYENMSLNASNYVYVNNYLEAGSSLRAPIFYDSANTGYYLDPNSTTSIRTVGSWRSDSSSWDGEFSGKIQYHANIWYFQSLSGWLFRNSGGSNVASIDSGGTLSINGDLYVGSSTSSNIYMTDTDEGTRRIHCNSNRIGFLNQAGNWGAYCDDGGNWVTPWAVYCGDWYYIDSAAGMYWTAYGYGFRSAHGAGSSYGNVCTYNTGRSGWTGWMIYDNGGYFTGTMFEQGNGGWYQETTGTWLAYWNRSNSCMGIGSSSTSSSYKLYVNGSIYATGDVVAYSDKRKKTDVVTIDNALDKVTNMRGVFYTKIGEEEKGRKTGVIAQEVNEILPEAVTYAADTDEYGVAYGNIVGVLIEAIKEQQKQIDELKAKLDGTPQ